MNWSSRLWAKCQFFYVQKILTGCWGSKAVARLSVRFFPNSETTPVSAPGCARRGGISAGLPACRAVAPWRAAAGHEGCHSRAGGLAGSAGAAAPRNPFSLPVCRPAVHPQARAPTFRLGTTWQDLAARAIERRPKIGKAAALPEPHPIIGSGYQRLDDDLLAVQLDGARITVSATTPSRASRCWPAPAPKPAAARPSSASRTASGADCTCSSRRR